MCVLLVVKQRGASRPPENSQWIQMLILAALLLRPPVIMEFDY